MDEHHDGDRAAYEAWRTELLADESLPARIDALVRRIARGDVPESTMTIEDVLARHRRRGGER